MGLDHASELNSKGSRSDGSGLVKEHQLSEGIACLVFSSTGF